MTESAPRTTAHYNSGGHSDPHSLTDFQQSLMSASGKSTVYAIPVPSHARVWPINNNSNRAPNSNNLMNLNNSYRKSIESGAQSSDQCGGSNASLIHFSPIRQEMRSSNSHIDPGDYVVNVNTNNPLRPEDSLAESIATTTDLAYAHSATFKPLGQSFSPSRASLSIDNGTLQNSNPLQRFSINTSINSNPGPAMPPGSFSSIKESPLTTSPEPQQHQSQPSAPIIPKPQPLPPLDQRGRNPQLALQQRHLTAQQKKLGAAKDDLMNVMHRMEMLMCTLEDQLEDLRRGGQPSREHDSIEAALQHLGQLLPAQLQGISQIAEAEREGAMLGMSLSQQLQPVPKVWQRSQQLPPSAPVLSPNRQQQQQQPPVAPLPRQQPSLYYQFGQQMPAAHPHQRSHSVASSPGLANIQPIWMTPPHVQSELPPMPRTPLSAQHLQQQQQQKPAPILKVPSPHFSYSARSHSPHRQYSELSAFSSKNTPHLPPHIPPFPNVLRSLSPFHLVGFSQAQLPQLATELILSPQEVLVPQAPSNLSINQQNVLLSPHDCASSVTYVHETKLSSHPSAAADSLLGSGFHHRTSTGGHVHNHFSFSAGAAHNISLPSSRHGAQLSEISIMDVSQDSLQHVGKSISSLVVAGGRHDGIRRNSGE